jgi:hypothetical protein
MSEVPGMAAWYEALITAIATHIVADRADRYEPRVIKRRPKACKRLREHRANDKRTCAASC